MYVEIVDQVALGEKEGIMKKSFVIFGRVVINDVPCKPKTYIELYRMCEI